MAVAFSSLGKGGVAAINLVVAEKERAASKQKKESPIIASQKSSSLNSGKTLIAYLQALSWQNNNNDPDEHSKEMSHAVTQQQSMCKLIGSPTLLTNTIDLVMAYLGPEPTAASLPTSFQILTPLTPKIAHRILIQALGTRVDLFITAPQKSSIFLDPQEACRAAIPYLKDIASFSMQGFPRQLGLRGISSYRVC